PARLAERRDQRPQRGVVESVASGMRQHSDAAGTADPRDRIIERRPAMRDEARLAIGQVALEYLVHVAADTLFDDVTREMRAADHRRIAAVPQRAGIRIGDADARQLVANLPRPFVAPAPGALETVTQRAVARVDPQPHHVDRLAAPGDRNLHARHEREPELG